MTEQGWLDHLVRLRRELASLRARTPKLNAYNEVANDLRAIDTKLGEIRVAFQQAVKKGKE